MHADVSFSYAPGKIILTGEHAVVYGSGAIAMAVDRGVRVAIRANSLSSRGICHPGQAAGADPRSPQVDELPHRVRDDSDNNGPTLKSVGLGLCGGARPDPNGEGPEVMRLALSKLIEMFGEETRGLEINVDSMIPAGHGLGSSAALSVAIVKGMLQYFGLDFNRDDLITRAMELETIFHGRPSGIDHTTIVDGGINYFKRHNGEFSIKQIECPRELKFVVGMAGPHLGTSRSVSALSDRMKRYPEIYERLMAGISKVSEQMRMALTAGRLAEVGDLMNINQGYLNALGVSTPKLEALCAIARDRGALGAKLTGAGGGGAVIALVDGDPEEVAEGFRTAGYLAFTVGSSTPGHPREGGDPVF